ncbi:CSD-domain-containing protein [Basidiobolus meristosporus CBS 931.73]|uniref:CSD-domain-containing protein n=1 Tax=Basidiobolus meristosporus CBS 931.73 TaxID=1314790 RepID=A0A1Y1Z8A0_9FUNG|nr:CSD-domain-containing protein [Basidiobolus meristosporus CBS 931.73]|eukprot:ORY06483.1 CSD-domain-containing protein [Basidiobolus meristosporus CBS 931.73]
MSSDRKTGRVKFFNCQKGYGFIIPDDAAETGNAEIFVHHSAIHNDGGFKSLSEGEEVEYDLVQGPKGMQAANVSGPNGAAVKGAPNFSRGGYGGYNKFGGGYGSHGGYGQMAQGGYGQFPPSGYGGQGGYGQFPPSYGGQQAFGNQGGFNGGGYGYGNQSFPHGPGGYGQSYGQQQPYNGEFNQPSAYDNSNQGAQY